MILTGLSDQLEYRQHDPGDVLALAFGTGKTGAILAAVRGDVVKSLITHVRAARAMLKADT